MNIAVMLIFMAAAFFAGLSAGLIKKAKKGSLPEVKPKESRQLDLLNEEYRNFLSYDGTEQT